MFANNNGLEQDAGIKAAPTHPQMGGMKPVKKEVGVKKEESNPKGTSSVRAQGSSAHMDLELPSRKRKISESVKERFTMTPASITSSKSKESHAGEAEDQPEQYDLKYKLKRIREAKITAKWTYCEACCRTTKVLIYYL